MSENIIYEDDLITAFLPDDSAAAGHIRITPKKSVKVENMERALGQRMFLCASLSATAVFEGLKAQGTNILMSEENGLHFDVIPRQPDDKIKLTWEPKKEDDAKLNRLKEKISEQTFLIGKKEKEAKSGKSEVDTENQAAVKSGMKKGRNEYFSEHMTRIP